MNTDDLLERAERGAISAREIAEVAALLTLDQDVVDPHRLLTILGHSGAVEHSSLVAKYLGRHDDPMLARAALDVLCNYWGLTQQYLPTVVSFARGQPWDVGDYARLMAISILGEYLRDKSARETELLRLLWDLFRNREERQIVREAAYCALARAGGKGWSEIPSAGRHFDLDSDIDQEVVETIKRLLGE